MEDFPSAENSIENFCREFPQSLLVKDSCILLKEIYVKEKKYSEALKLLNQMQKLFTKDSDFCQKIEFEKALIMAQIDKFKNAIMYWRNLERSFLILL